MTKTYCSILSVILLFVCLATAASVGKAQVAEHSCAKAKRAPFTIICKDRYFLGETPTIAIVITNTGRTLSTVKEAEHQKFSIEMTGVFGNDSGREKKKTVYDGSLYIPPRQETTTGLISWMPPVVRPPKYVTLRPGEFTSMKFDLPRSFHDEMVVGKYKLTIKAADGKKATREFEVYFDNEKSVAVFAKMLANDHDLSERNRALAYLSRFNLPKLVSLLEDLVRSGNDRQRQFANGLLAEIKAGRFR